MSAWAIIDRILRNKAIEHALVQKEIVKRRKKLTKGMAEKCFDLMTVEAPRESDIVIP